MNIYNRFSVINVIVSTQFKRIVETMASDVIQKLKNGDVMSFAILRTSKLKRLEIGGSLGHTFRIMKTPNADKSNFILMNMNIH